ncbi:hypothetical protein evm_003326 [Chilo suppressalis]|nr:hypothetical protein evm_003326 [Chilo suppressalis]
MIRTSKMRTVWILLTAAVVTVSPASINTNVADEINFDERIIEESILIKGKQPRNNIIEGVLWGLIEDLRNVILNGNEEIPPLDPLIIEHVSLTDEDIPLPGVKLDLSGVTVTNLASFVIEEMSVTLSSLLLQRFRVQINGRIPSLDAVADHYDIDVSAMGFNLFGAGDAKVKLINPALRIDMLVALRVNIIQGISLNLLETTAQFNLEAFRSEINGIFNDDYVSAFINVFLEDFVPSALQAYEVEINEFISEIVHDIVSDIFDNLDL